MCYVIEGSVQALRERDKVVLVLILFKLNK